MDHLKHISTQHSNEHTHLNKIKGTENGSLRESTSWQTFWRTLVVGTHTPNLSFVLKRDSE